MSASSTSGPYEMGHVPSTALATRAAAAPDEWPDLDRLADRLADTRRPIERGLDRGCLDQVEAPDVLLGLGEGPVGALRLARPADDPGSGRLAEPGREQERAGRLHVGLDPGDPGVASLLLLVGH